MKIKLSRSTLSVIAGRIAASASFTNNNRKTYWLFQNMIKDVLLCLNSGSKNKVLNIISSAETNMKHVFPGVNIHRALYIPLVHVVEAWRIASEHTTSSASGAALDYIWHIFPDWRGFLSDITAYEDTDYMEYYKDPEEAQTTLSAWNNDCCPDDLPYQDPGLLWLFWNLYMFQCIKKEQEEV